jgi:hypothetical protein
MPKNGGPYNPNSLTDRASVEHWLGFCDFYQFKHITQFDSWDQLLDLLQNSDLQAISDKMRIENKRVLEELNGTWKKMFGQMFKDIKPGGRQVPQDFDTAMRTLYGETLSGGEPSCHRKSAPESGQWN